SDRNSTPGGKYSFSVNGNGIERKRARTPTASSTIAYDDTTFASCLSLTFRTRFAGTPPFSLCRRGYRYGPACKPEPTPVPSAAANWDSMANSNPPGAFVRDGRLRSPSRLGRSPQP